MCYANYIPGHPELVSESGGSVPFSVTKIRQPCKARQTEV